MKPRAPPPAHSLSPSASAWRAAKSKASPYGLLNASPYASVPARWRSLPADKWTYIIGDLTLAHADDVVAAAISFQRSPNGIVPWAERPQPFRKGVIARVPPLGFVQPDPETP